MKEKILLKIFLASFFLVNIVYFTSANGEWFPSKDPYTSIPLVVENQTLVEFEGITPYSRVDKKGADFFALKIEGPTVANFEFELEMHPEVSYCKGIWIDYYKKKKMER